MIRSSFTKTTSSRCDTITVKSLAGSEWIDITVSIDERELGKITLRSDEDVRDLHYTLGRYLSTIEGAAHG